MGYEIVDFWTVWRDTLSYYKMEWETLKHTVSMVVNTMKGH